MVDQGFQVNLHLVYTVQQDFMAFAAGATYVCPLVGRLQDQGHDALGLVQECVEITKRYGYKSKIMFSSVRHAEHVKNALSIGVHTITVPWKVMQKLTENHFTTIGTDQFVQDTRALMNTVKNVVVTEHVSISSSAKIIDALLMMTKSKLGAVAILNTDGSFRRIFTDCDLRRLIQQNGDNVQDYKLDSLPEQVSFTIGTDRSLHGARNVFASKGVDTLVAMNGEPFAGLIDIQHTL